MWKWQTGTIFCGPCALKCLICPHQAGPHLKWLTEISAISLSGEFGVELSVCGWICKWVCELGMKCLPIVLPIILGIWMCATYVAEMVFRKCGMCLDAHFCNVQWELRYNCIDFYFVAIEVLSCHKLVLSCHFCPKLGPSPPHMVPQDCTHLCWIGIWVGGSWLHDSCFVAYWLRVYMVVVVFFGPFMGDVGLGLCLDLSMLYVPLESLEPAAMTGLRMILDQCQTRELLKTKKWSKKYRIGYWPTTV